MAGRGEDVSSDLHRGDSMSRCLRSFADRRILSLQAVIFAALVLAATSPALADDAADAIINKAIKAMGGEARLAKATTSKVKGTFALPDSAFEFTIEHTIDGIDRERSTFEGDFGGNKSTTVTVIDGDKGWIKVGAMEVRELEGEELADQKWALFSQSMHLALVPLKRKDLKFKTESVPDERVGDKPAAGVKVTGPDNKDFTIYFDKETGLPVKVVADLPDPGSPGQEFTQETYYRDYKDFGGVKWNKKSEIKRDGETFIEMELVDVKVLDKIDEKTFAKPE
jgi:hypothetical protein